MQIDDLEQAAGQVSGIMKLLSAPNRLMILCQLVEQERSVGDLCSLLGMKPPAMSQQLSILRREDILSTRREGQTIYYFISDENILKLMTFLYETYCRDL